MSQPSHFREMLVGNTLTTGYHTRKMSSSYSIEKKKTIIQRVKGIEWDRKQWHP
jgi:hypothetical protein